MAVRVSISIPEPLYEDLEKNRQVAGEPNRSTWYSYLLARGLEIFRREREVIGNAPALAGAEA